ncbi:MAG: restriction endonuclease [Methylacidiphilales bacterium]|nr:restriction endonuclease [Candidatus Methylacidiphilales bacterium]
MKTVVFLDICPKIFGWILRVRWAGKKGVRKVFRPFSFVLLSLALGLPTSTYQSTFREMNQLYYGDNLYVLRECIATESVDLIYLDPPFNSQRDYNLLFKTPKGHRSEAQIEAFKDSWHWGEQAEREFDELLHQPNTDVAQMMHALRAFLGVNDMMAYLTMMANRLLELHRVLKPNGSLYLHCDPTASHYLKVVLDGVLGKLNYRNEIIWKRTLPHGNQTRKYGSSHDVIFFYAKTDRTTWNGSFHAHREEYLTEFYKHKEPDGRIYRLISCINPNPNRPNLTYEWNGVMRVWKYTKERMKRMHDEGLIVYSKNGVASYKGYLDQMKGMPTQDIWDDIFPLMGSSEERLGYPTQKPLALLERIISASSNEGDVVLDPFCGCGTAVDAAQKLKRPWIGIDITHLAISLIEKRLKDRYGAKCKFEVHGTPKDIEAARDLARRDKYQFQWWAVSLVNAQPFQGRKKGADTGIDGIKYFHDADKEGARKIIASVKGGEHVGPAMVKDLIATIARDQAEIGLFITLSEPTKAMTAEAAAAGFYESATGKKYPRLQILTIEGLLSGKERAEHPDQLPDMNFKKAPTEQSSRQEELL